MRKVLFTETTSEINGGQKMSLLVADMLTESRQYEAIWAIPEEGRLSEQLKVRGMKYYLLGNVDLPAGVKDRSVIFKYAVLSLLSIRKIIRIISKEKVDIIYSPGPASLPWAAVCGSIKRRPVIWHLHHIFSDSPTMKLLNICGEFNSVRRIVSVSESVSNQMASKVAHEKVKVLYNPVDYQKYRNGNANNISGEIPFSYNFDKTKLIIEQIGTIHPSKEQDKVIRICGSLLERGCDVFAVFIGGCNDSEAEYRNELVTLAEKLGMRDRIFFLGLRDDVNDLIKGAGVILVPSIEGFSLVALEAMAAGIPVVATERCGVGELIKNSRAGYTYREDEDNSVICDKIMEACIDTNISANGYKFALRHNDLAYKSELLELFSFL